MKFLNSIQINKTLFIVFLISLISAQTNNLYAANVTFTSTSVTLGSTTGCGITNYTFAQYVPNDPNAPMNSGVTVTIVFPAGVNISTATMAGSSYYGSSITTGWTIVGQTLTFSSPVAVPKKKDLVIVIANITNGNNTSANATVSIPNTSGGNNSATTYSITTTTCPVVPTNDNCGTPTVVTPSPAGSGTCSTINATTYGASASPQTVCTGQADDDVWFSFVANNPTHQVTIDGDANFNGVIQIFSGTCAGTLTSLACVNSTGLNGIETSNLSGLTIGQTYLVRVYHSAAGFGSSAANAFTICVTSTTPPCAIGAAGTNATVTLPLSATAYTTCGMGNDITSLNASSICGSSSYYGGEDKVIIFTPSSSGNISITLTSSGSWVGMMLYQGCPTSGGSCVAFAQGSSGNQSIGCATVVAGLTYYLVVDSYPSPTCNAFSLSITAPSGGIPAGTTCSNAVSMTLPYTVTGQSTLCFGNDYTNASTGSCGTLYESGEDKVYSFTTTGPDCLNLLLTNASTSYIGFQVYSGCPGTAGTTCIANGGGASSGSLVSSFTVPSAGTYYLVIDTWASPSYVNYDLQLVSLGGSPSNDLACNAQSIPLGATVSGDNNCSGGASEPAVPAGWSSGTLNTVWYSVTIPASGSIVVKTVLGSLTNTQIAAYSGACGSLTFVSANNDIGSCGGTSNYASQLTLSGSVGQVFYIRVDGEYNLTGTFSILSYDISTPIPGVQGQDCSQPNPVCQSTMSVSNPGYSGNGNICDINSGYCLSSGERNVVWYRVPISAGGTLNFNIVPNDFVSATESETDYDFAVWKIASGTPGDVLGTDYFNCSQIAAGTAPPVSCNYNYLGVTGVGTGGNPPSSLSAGVCPQCGGGYNPSGTYGTSYEPTITAVTNDEYLIAISNYSNSTSGFKIEFLTGGGAATINYAAATATNEVYWTGGDVSIPTEWTDVDNWGGCAAPSCSRDAIVSALANEPILLSGQIYDVHDLTIQTGAVLTLQANSTLRICGDFTNYGSLNADPTSTIIFVGSTNQTVSGSFTASNRFGNFTVTKLVSTGTVLLNNDIEIGGTFTTSNTNSILNTNGKYVTLSGNFLNNNGNTTYTNTGSTGTLNLNGTGIQNYNQGSSQLDLNFVVLSNTSGLGAGVTLLTNMFIKNTTGTLTLTQGTVTTNGFRVDVANTAVASVTVGNTTSFVNGNLRRYLLSTGAYNWPVGNVAKGYQRALTTFTSNSNAYIDGRFDIWPSTLPIQGGTQCGGTFNYDAMDNGYWTLTATGSSAIYNISLFPLNVTNVAAGWTVMKRASYATTGWILDGVCVASTATQVNRNTLSGFSVFGVAQSPIALPMELIEFSGEIVGEDNLLTWITGSEHNNDYFSLERSRNGYEFEVMATIDGAGNSTSILDYEHFDFDPYSKTTYYRLKQTDFDGQFSYSQTIALSRDIQDVNISELFPNPANNNVNFEINTPKSGKVTVELFDNAGRLIMSRSYVAHVGSNNFNIEINHLARGFYSTIIHFDQLEKAEIRQLIKN